MQSDVRRVGPHMAFGDLDMAEAALKTLTTLFNLCFFRFGQLLFLGDRPLRSLLALGLLRFGARFSIKDVVSDANV